MFFLFPARPSRNCLTVFLCSRIYPVEAVVNDRSHLLLWRSSSIVDEVMILQEPCFLALKATDNYRYDSIDFVVCPGFVRSVKTLQTTFLLWKMFIQLVPGQRLGGKIRVLSIGVEPTTFWLLVKPFSFTQSYRRLDGAKATKLGSCHKHPAYC